MFIIYFNFILKYTSIKFPWIRKQLNIVRSQLCKKVWYIGELLSTQSVKILRVSYFKQVYWIMNIQVYNFQFAYSRIYKVYTYKIKFLFYLIIKSHLRDRFQHRFLFVKLKLCLQVVSIYNFIDFYSFDPWEYEI